MCPSVNMAVIFTAHEAKYFKLSGNVLVHPDYDGVDSLRDTGKRTLH